MDDTTLVSRFLRDGFVKSEGAVAPRVAADCARLLWRETGCDRDDPATWTQPVHWVAGMAQGPFAAAPNSPSLQRAYDLLVGAGCWEPRYSLGTFPLRFPHEEEPDDAGCGSRWSPSTAEQSGKPAGAGGYERAASTPTSRRMTITCLSAEAEPTPVGVVPERLP